MKAGCGSRNSGTAGTFAEKKRALNWSLLYLRTYDGRTGRFHNPDPMWQYASPYMAMGNNPLSVVDPTGGEDSDPGHGGNCRNPNCPNHGSNGSGASASDWMWYYNEGVNETDWYNLRLNGYGFDHSVDDSENSNYDPGYVAQAPSDWEQKSQYNFNEGTVGDATVSMNGPCRLCPLADFLRNTPSIGGVLNPFYNAEALYMDGGGGLAGSEFDVDGMGPKLERFGGIPYPYLPVKGTFEFMDHFY